MPGDSSQRIKTVQTVLTKKALNKDNASTQEKPAKQGKRTHSNVSEESIDTIDLTSIHADLCEIKTSLQETIKKHDLENAVDGLVKKNELHDVVTNIVSQLISTLKEEYNARMKEATNKLQDQVDTLFMENNNLKEKLCEKNRQIKQLEETTLESNVRSKEALKQCNYNEQYSRKNNIRILNLPEKKMKTCMKYYQNF